MCLIRIAYSLGIFLFMIWLVCVLLRIYLKLTTGRCKSNACLVGKTALVTGGNSGIGYQTALGLAARGCRVIIADKDNCDNTKEKIIEATNNRNIVAKQFDLASLNSVRELAKEINEAEEKLHILINNAGTSGLGNVHTEDGLHMGMQVNHFGPFLLTNLLIELLKKSAPSRIIFVSSSLVSISNLSLRNLNYPKDAPATRWSDIMVYANSKLCNIITTNVLAKKLYGTGITANSLHPGVVCTSIYKNYAIGHNLSPRIVSLIYDYFLKYFAKDAEEGAQTTLHLATAKEVEKLSGKYFSDCQVRARPLKSREALLSWQIWEASEKYVKLSVEEKL